MRAVKQRDTRVEVAVRRLLHEMGVRFRVQARDLPGSPDIVNRRGQWALWINGCYWHGHKNCPRTRSGDASRVPVSNRGYWKAKFIDNRKRDARDCRELRARGFRVAIVWECQLVDRSKLKHRLQGLIAGSIGSAHG